MFSLFWIISIWSVILSLFKVMVLLLNEVEFCISYKSWFSGLKVCLVIWLDSLLELHGNSLICTLLLCVSVWVRSVQIRFLTKVFENICVCVCVCACSAVVDSLDGHVFSLSTGSLQVLIFFVHMCENHQALLLCPYTFRAILKLDFYLWQTYFCCLQFF